MNRHIPRWTHPRPRIPSTRKGLQPITPVYIPAAPKKVQN